MTSRLNAGSDEVYSSAWTAPALAEPAPWCLLGCARRARGSASAHGPGKEILSKHGGDLYLIGLPSLSDAAAESLSKHGGGLSLSDAAENSLRGKL